MKHTRAALVAVLLISLSLAAQAAGTKPAVVKGVEFVKSDTCLEVSVQITGDFSHKTIVLSSPNRLVIDVSPTQRIKAGPANEVNAFGVKDIRVGQYKRRVSRVILDFSGDVPPYDVQKTKTGLVIVITGAPQAAASPAPVQEEKTAEPAKPPAQSIPPAPKPAEPAKPAAENKPPAPKPSETASPAAKAVAPAPKPAPQAAPPASEPAKPAARPSFYNTTVGVMAGSYRSDSSRFREVYGSGTSVQFGLNLSRTLLYYGGLQLDVSVEARMVSKTGKATVLGQETKIKMYPISLAGRLLYQTKYVIPFVGYGADWYNYKETSSLANTSGSASGDHFQGGLYVIIPGQESLRIKIYYKYTRVTARENGIDVKLGGPEFGLGVSYGFNFLNKAVLNIQ